MTNNTGRAGKSTRELARKRRNKGLLLVLMAFIAGVAIWLLLQNSRVLGIGGFGVLVLLILLGIVPDVLKAQANRQRKAKNRAIRGAVAEEKIESLLQTLGENYFVLHDIESPYGNIDHIVISNEGRVFLLETKSHHGKAAVMNGELLINGKPPEKDFINQALKNVYWLRKQIREIVGIQIWITPVIVFTSAFVPPGKSVKGVTIINKKYLPDIFVEKSSVSESTLQVWEAKEAIAKLIL